MGNGQLLSAYLARVSNAIDDEDGLRLSSLLTIEGDHTREVVNAICWMPNVESFVRKKLDDSWTDVVVAHLKVLKELTPPSPNVYGGKPSNWSGDNDIVRAAELQNAAAQAFHQMFVTQTCWCLPVLYAINGDLWKLSAKADYAMRRKGAVSGRLEEAARTMNKAFSYCVTDRFSPLDKSRKWGTYHIVNLLFKTYFKLTQTNLCTTILRSVAAGDLPPLERYPMADQATYRYYVGVLAFYNEQYRKAEEDLSFALWHCYRRTGDQGSTERSDKNIILILNYLIPTRFMLGLMPSWSLLTKYPALEYLYGSFASAIRRGDVRLFDRTLSNLQRDLINRGTYLTVERARALAVRMLFKKVWLINERSTRIPMGQFQRALQLAGTDASQEAVGCLMANMIDKGLLRGYISYEKQMVVTAKDDPFPRAVPI